MIEQLFTAAQLKDWRKSYGWTQEQAAAQLEMSLDTYRPKEQGRRPITRQDMKLIRYIDRDAVKKKATA